MDLRTRTLALVLALVGCAKPGPTATPSVTVDPAATARTPSEDLPILRQKAAMGLVDAVRAELVPRLAAAREGADDPGRDALRALSVQLALLQGDREGALREMGPLSRELDRRGERATADERARWHLLYSACLFEHQSFSDARGHVLQALGLVSVGPETPLVADILRELARDQLALGDPERALESLRRAMAGHKDSLSRQDDLLLAVDVMVVLQQPSEAVIAAGQLYDAAIEAVGPDTLAHAEALAAAASATLASGDLDACRSFLSDAREIWSALQAARVDPRLPVSARLERRLAAVEQALGVYS